MSQRGKAGLTATLQNSGADRCVPAPFLVGMPDSGVELLRLMLDAHPELALPGPTFFVPGVLELRDNHPPCANAFSRSW